MPKRRTGLSRPSRPSSVPPGTCASRRRRMNFVVPSLRARDLEALAHAADAVVAVAVAVGVLDDEADAAAALARDHTLDDAVADADHLRARLALDVHVVALLGVVHDARRALAGAHPLERGVAVERAVVARHRPRTGKRPSARPVSAPTIDVGICGDRLRALEHVGDVPVGVVVGEDRAAQVGLARRPPSGTWRRRRSRRPGCTGPCSPSRLASVPYIFQVAGMNCIQPCAPADETFRLRP